MIRLESDDQGVAVTAISLLASRRKIYKSATENLKIQKILFDPKTTPLDASFVCFQKFRSLFKTV